MDEDVSNFEVLAKMETKWKAIYNIEKGQLTFFEYITRKEGLGNLIHTGRIEGKSGSEK